MRDLQRGVYAPAELLELLTARLSDSRIVEHLTPHFPSIAALRLYGQRAAAAAAHYASACSKEQGDASAALDEACMSFLSFAEAASRTLKQPRILNDAVRLAKKKACPPSSETFFNQGPWRQFVIII